MKNSFLTINVLAYQEEGIWIAQGVEHDIFARAQSLPKLPEAFGKSLAINICINEHLGRKGLDGIDPAPESIREAFDNAQYSLKETSSQEHSIQKVRVIEMKVAELT